MNNIYSYKSKMEFQYLNDNYNVFCCSLNDLFQNNFINNYNYYEYIDITLFVENVLNNPSNKVLLYNLKECFDYDCKIIIHENLVDTALNLFYTIFNNEIKLSNYINFPNFESERSFKKKIIYYYQTNEELNYLIEYCNLKNILFFDVSLIYYKEIIENELFKGEQIIDITPYLENRSLFKIDFIYKLLSNQEITFICNFSSYNDDLSFYFKEKEHISKKYSDFIIKSDNLSMNIIKITNLENKKFNKLKTELNYNLIGHDVFKEDLINELNNFRILNSLNIKKIFTIFILGDSGLGKTEVARIINKFLDKDKKLIKINFGNYSTNDSLNSLIGSPRGYIGSENGELSIKLDKPHNGVILCDEFEKANSQIINFFLELLEDGKFTDSQSREYDLNGFIIIFTSNFNKNQFINNFSNEFISRVDLISNFEHLTFEEKMKFVRHKINEINENFKNNKQFRIKLNESEFDINLHDSNNLRVIEKEIYKQAINIIKEDV